MKKALITSLIVTLAPLSVLAVTTGSNVRNTFIIQSQSGKTQTGTTRNWVTVSGEIVRSINQANIDAIKDVARPKSRLETAVERQRQRQADLDKQHEEQRAEEDRQRALVAAWEAKKKAEEEERQAALRYMQPGETIESYCARAQTQWFLKSFINRNTVQECIDKIKARKRLARRIVRERSKSNSSIERTLSKLCKEEYQKTGNIPTFCEEYVTRTNTGTTQSGGTLTTSR